MQLLTVSIYITWFQLCCCVHLQLGPDEPQTRQSMIEIPRYLILDIHHGVIDCKPFCLHTHLQAEAQARASPPISCQSMHFWDNNTAWCKQLRTKKLQLHAYHNKGWCNYKGQPPLCSHELLYKKWWGMRQFPKVPWAY